MVANGGLTVRALPTTASAAKGLIPKGKVFPVVCKVRGTSVGGNTIWYALPPAYAAGQAGAVAHVAAHDLGAAAYAIKAVRAAAAPGDAELAGRIECQWQRDQLPDAIRELVLDDQRLRNDICWSVFDC